MSRHTPAPWEPHGKPMGAAHVEVWAAAEAIAKTFPRGYTDEMVSANFRVILAAPLLLELIEQTVATCQLLNIELPPYSYVNTRGGVTKQQSDRLLARMEALLTEVRP